MSKFKYGMCLSDYQKNKEYMNLSKKRSLGKVPEPEHAKASAKIIKTIIICLSTNGPSIHEI